MNDGIKPDDMIILESKINIANARKDVDNLGKPYDILKDMDDLEICSEWAIAYAMQPHNVGDSMTANKWAEALQEAVLQQFVDHMVELGYMEAVFTEDETLGYRLTAEGNQYAIGKLKL